MDQLFGNVIVHYGHYVQTDIRRIDSSLGNEYREYTRTRISEITESYKKEEIKLIDQRGAGLGALLMASVHPQDGNRMGEDESASVVDSHCESHEIDNLFICDASVFPTAVGVNPQYTVMAIATMTSDYINNNPAS